jgi:hypothetical protein
MSKSKFFAEEDPRTPTSRGGFGKEGKWDREALGEGIRGQGKGRE